MQENHSAPYLAVEKIIQRSLNFIAYQEISKQAKLYSSDIFCSTLFELCKIGFRDHEVPSSRIIDQSDGSDEPQRPPLDAWKHLKTQVNKIIKIEAESISDVEKSPQSKKSPTATSPMRLRTFNSSLGTGERLNSLRQKRKIHLKKNKKELKVKPLNMKSFIQLSESEIRQDDRLRKIVSRQKINLNTERSPSAKTKRKMPKTTKASNEGMLKNFAFDHNGVLLRKPEKKLQPDSFPVLFRKGFKFSLNNGSESQLTTHTHSKAPLSLDKSSAIFSKVPDHFQKEDKAQPRMLTNSSIDLHRDVRMFTAEGERKSKKRLEESLNQYDSFLNTTRRMSRKVYQDRFNNSNMLWNPEIDSKFGLQGTLGAKMGKFIPFHPINAPQPNETCENNAENSLRYSQFRQGTAERQGSQEVPRTNPHQNPILQSMNNESLLENTSNMSQLKAKIFSHQNRRHTMSSRRKIKTKSSIHLKNNQIIRSGTSDISVLINCEDQARQNVTFEEKQISKPMTKSYRRKRYGILADMRASMGKRKSTKIQSYLRKV
ncbi:unnamed protein product [Moneuplotes crassus]|uniref:Uncharacterized protein n=1 Tax=Euplotes crassus TaxID=5936 RepID=A0AAD1U5E6_EUPCR|nr:unnamed protein product [Moneuplotes crassus]